MTPLPRAVMRPSTVVVSVTSESSSASAMPALPFVWLLPFALAAESPVPVARRLAVPSASISASTAREVVASTRVYAMARPTAMPPSPSSASFSS